MELIQAVIGAIIAWIVPKLLDHLLAKGKQESGAGTDLVSAFPWTRWCVAHTIAGGVGGFLSGVLGLIGLNTPGGVGNWSVFGVAIGIAQWIVLKRYNNFGPFWAVASALGWSVWSIFQAAQAPGYLGWSAVGFAVGILQWVVLRRERNRAYFWVPANVIAWLVAGTLGFAIGMGLLSAQAPFSTAWVVGWSAVGLFGSIILGWSLRHMPNKEVKPST
ncbi:hypothetical protein BTA51_13895 [Hahella sp. CCB-MM4]|uniref:hypothetical protein n=1 Tax=Hahella sp. (strain CCB-MM4) TaxID=1926491 RepID=UPI000B9B6AB6|nr:hypothetical protein [Hahella sp. CCB-MM4]OZG72617.1 hypothetical protein BTA51_13895 [Hahella sp. CCB-MM4]